MLNFFAGVHNEHADANLRAIAVALFSDYKFLQDSPDNPAPSGRFRSTFLIELISCMHLSAIIGFVEIPDWALSKMARGNDQGGVIAIASAAVRYFVGIVLRQSDLLSLHK